MKTGLDVHGSNTNLSSNVMLKCSFKVNDLLWFSSTAPDVIPKNVKGVGTWRNNMEISWEVIGIKTSQKSHNFNINTGC